MVSDGIQWVVEDYNLTITASITPGAVTNGADSSSVQTFNNFTGLLTGDGVSLIKAPASTLGVSPLANRCTAPDTAELIFINVTAGALTPAAGDYTIKITR